MSLSVIQPPGDEAKFAEVGKELYAAAKALGMNIDVEGFLHAWVSGLRVVIERDDDTKEITGMVLLQGGLQWNQNRHTASVMEIRGRNVDNLVEFTKQVASAMGAQSLFIEMEGWIPSLIQRVVESLNGYEASPSDAAVTAALDKVFALDYPGRRIRGVLEFILQ